MSINADDQPQIKEAIDSLLAAGIRGHSGSIVSSQSCCSSSSWGIAVASFFLEASQLLLDIVELLLGALQLLVDIVEDGRGINDVRVGIGCLLHGAGRDSGLGGGLLGVHVVVGKSHPATLA